MEENRVLHIHHDAIERLHQLSQSSPKPGTFDEVRELLPMALTPEEIGWVGFKINNLAELQDPSRDGMSNGRKAEVKAVFLMGNVAVVGGDLVSAQNAAGYLRREARSISGFVGAAVLSHEVRRKIKKREKAHSFLRVVK